MLILFDIDRTLIETDAVGIACLRDAGRSLFGPSFTVEGVAFGGRLDPLIIREMFANSNIEHTADRAVAMRHAYHDRMKTAVRPGVSRALKGTAALVDALEALGESVTLGLLTGNFEETGRLKLAAAGFDTDRFPVRVWGDESPFDPPRPRAPAPGRHATLPHPPGPPRARRTRRRHRRHRARCLLCPPQRLPSPGRRHRPRHR
jgi:phosphoglycolate phosphatase-like HAD superfamily hydrolase